MTEEANVLSLTDDEDDFEDEPLPELSGTLFKWTNYLHGWQDRYIVLKDSTISYYKSEDETAFGCRGAVLLMKANVTPHQFDECRFDVSVNDSVWYLRTATPEERQTWIESIELHKQADSSYGSENNLRRHGSMLSLTSGTSISQASTSSFKRGRGLKEKLAEMETFRDILCRQIDTLQSYFDSCASAVTLGVVHELHEHDDLEDDLDVPHSASSHDVHSHRLDGLRGKDLASILQQHGGHAVDFKGEAFTFKATTAGIIATLSHCIELMGQREDAWKKRMDREVDKRKKFEEAYKSLMSDKNKKVIVGGPDYEEGPHCMITEDEFYDAVDATLDKLEKEEEKQKKNVDSPLKPEHAISLAPTHSFYNEINEIVSNHLRRLLTDPAEEKGDWTCIVDQGDLKVHKRELEENGVPIDPMKAVCTVQGITGHEVCYYFWAFDTRMEWEATLEHSRVVEWLSDDTFISNNVIKRVWPASQRDACFWSHLRHMSKKNDEGPDSWIVVNYSCEHPDCPPNKFVRITMNVALICETIIEPPASGEITRDNITCKITYTADVNPGGWAPASVLRAVYKREYPKFLRRFTSFVADKTNGKDILF